MGQGVPCTAVFRGRIRGSHVAAARADRTPQAAHTSPVGRRTRPVRRTSRDRSGCRGCRVDRRSGRSGRIRVARAAGQFGRPHSCRHPPAGDSGRVDRTVQGRHEGDAAPVRSRISLLKPAGCHGPVRALAQWRRRARDVRGNDFQLPGLQRHLACAPGGDGRFLGSRLSPGSNDCATREGGSAFA